ESRAPDPKSAPPIYLGVTDPHEIAWFPAAPPWRQFTPEAQAKKGAGFRVERDKENQSKTVDMVNAALLLRRPLLVTGKPGTGKSTLAHAIAHELRFDEVLVWPVTTRTTLQSGLYEYDAIGRLNAAAIRRQGIEEQRSLHPADAVPLPAAEL